MDMKEYIVTCKSRKNLQSLYNDIETEGGTLYIPNRAIELVDRREISRNTHYKLTADEAELISNDKRVLSCALSPTEVDGLEPVLYATDYVNPELYQVGADFTKKTTNFIQDQYFRQWGHLHSAGNTIQRRKNSWGTGGVVTDNVEVYNDGRHVDVVIVDGMVGFDSDEWESEALTPGQSRMKQYDWYANHPTVYSGNYGYPPVSGAHDHGMHVAGTVAGKYYGWAKEADIYALTFNGAHGVLRIFDLIREFHKNKPINPVTGRKNPTITNNSWGFNYTADWNYTDVNSIYFRGQTYNSSNPGPSGWSNSGIHADFGIKYNANGFPVREPSLDADIEDAIEEGIVVVGAAGNSNHYIVREGHQDYNNYANINGLGSQIYMHRGSSPGSAKGVICVGAQDSDSDHRRAQFTNYGDRVDVFAPGEHILSVGGSGNYAGVSALKGPITRPGYGAGVDNMLTFSGTSMASPQVTGILACAATNRERFTHDDAMGYIRGLSRDDLMDFDKLGSAGSTWNFSIDTAQTTFNDYYLSGTDLSGIINGFDPSININHTDTIIFNLDTSSYVYYQVDAGQTGNGYQMTDSNGVQSWNPTINLTVGDQFELELYSNMTTHPIYIRDSSGNDLSTGVSGQGANNQGQQIFWDTTGYSAGTYKYQCGNHPGMQGTINLSNPSPYVHPLFIREANGNNISSVIDNGFANGATQVRWTPGNAYAGQTVIYQCGNHGSMKGNIVVNAGGNVGQQGGFDDQTCSKESPNREVFCNNPRPINGYVSGWKQSTLNGRRRTDREDNNANQDRQVYPRVNGFYRT